jgi:cytochrome c6
MSGDRVRWPPAALLLAALLLKALLGGAMAQAADLQRGSQLYQQHCALCHGPAGRPVLPGTPDLSRPAALLQPDLALLAGIRGGRGAMPAYQGVLRDRDILDIVAHLRTLR